jgi:hypothetical protein
MDPKSLEGVLAADLPEWGERSKLFPEYIDEGRGYWHPWWNVGTTHICEDPVVFESGAFSAFVETDASIAMICGSSGGPLSEAMATGNTPAVTKNLREH